MVCCHCCCFIMTLTVDNSRIHFYYKYFCTSWVPGWLYHMKYPCACINSCPRIHVNMCVLVYYILYGSWIFNEIEAHTFLTYQGLMPKPSDNLCDIHTPTYNGTNTLCNMSLRMPATSISALNLSQNASVYRCAPFHRIPQY